MTGQWNPENAIFEGMVEHRRYVERDHSFSYRVYMLFLKVREIDDPSKAWTMISRSKFAPLSVCATDYMAHRKESSLRERLVGEIKDKLGKIWEGEAFVLAQPRHFGFVMNPLATYYCYGADNRLMYIVGEITNTPWGERHCYVFDMHDAEGERPKTFKFKKEFHVSPFLPMKMDYTWVMNTPRDHLTIGIWNKSGERLDFEAHLNLKRHNFTARGLLRRMLLMPLMTFKVLLGIYINAGILFAIKRVTFYDHPKLARGGQK